MKEWQAILIKMERKRGMKIIPRFRISVAAKKTRALMQKIGAHRRVWELGALIAVRHCRTIMKKRKKLVERSADWRRAGYTHVETAETAADGKDSDREFPGNVCRALCQYWLQMRPRADAVGKRQKEGGSLKS